MGKDIGMGLLRKLYMKRKVKSPANPVIPDHGVGEVGYGWGVAGKSA